MVSKNKRIMKTIAFLCFNMAIQCRTCEILDKKGGKRNNRDYKTNTYTYINLDSKSNYKYRSDRNY